MQDYALILANDITEPEKMLAVTRAACPYLDGVKIGITSSMVPGVSIYQAVREILGGKSLALFGDYKVADIGFKDKKSGKWGGTNEKIVRALAEAGVDFITCHTFPGLASIDECVAAAHVNGAKVLTLPYMTHEGADLFFNLPLGAAQRGHLRRVLQAYGVSPSEHPELYAAINGAKGVMDAIIDVGNHFGVDGFIAPGNNPEMLRRYRSRTNKQLWCPGFGRQDKSGRNLESQIEDWARIVGPNSAMIVGSLIFNADDPAMAAQEVRESRDKALTRL